MKALCNLPLICYSHIFFPCFTSLTCLSLAASSANQSQEYEIRQILVSQVGSFSICPEGLEPQRKILDLWCGHPSSIKMRLFILPGSTGPSANQLFGASLKYYAMHSSVFEQRIAIPNSISPMPQASTCVLVCLWDPWDSFATDIPETRVHLWSLRPLHPQRLCDPCAPLWPPLYAVTQVF